jgi:signal peptidase II
LVKASREAMPRFTGWLLLSALVIVLDQASKAWVMASIPLNGGFPVMDFFNLVFIFNRGAAFSFLSGADGWQRWLFLGLAVAISSWIAWMMRRHAAERLQPAALALILGGAVGNAIDRVRLGAVVDFLDFHYAGWHFWAFNVADSAISLGVALLLVYQITLKETRND